MKPIQPLVSGGNADSSHRPYNKGIRRAATAADKLPVVGDANMNIAIQGGIIAILIGVIVVLWMMKNKKK